MTDWTPEEDEAFNDVEKHSNLGKQILREIGQPYHFQKREWVELTRGEIEALPDNLSKVEFAWLVETKLREKNS